MSEIFHLKENLITCIAIISLLFSGKYGNLSKFCKFQLEEGVNAILKKFLAVPQGCLQFVIVVFPDHTHLLFLWWDGLICRLII